MEAIWQDFRYAVRMMIQKPAFAALIVLTLALGIGANTAIFSVVNSILLRALPYPESDRLMLLTSTQPTGSIALSPLDFMDLTEQSKTVESSAAILPDNHNVTGSAEPERIAGAAVSWNFFNVMRIKPELGRAFIRNESTSSSQKVAIISNSLWKRRYDGSTKIVGDKIVLNGEVHTILGVMPKGFAFPQKTEVWQPLVFDRHELDPSQRGARYLTALARLKQGVAVQAAQNEIAALGLQLQKLYPRSNERTGAAIVPLQEFMVKNIRTSLLVLLGAVSFVLLMACANVANLLLARAARRETEVAVRSALGAGRWRLIRQFLIEALVLTFLAGVCALVVALWCIELLETFGPANLPRLKEVSLDLRVLSFTFAVAFLTGFLIGIFPALQVTGGMAQNLRSGARTMSPSSKRFRKILVTGEVAVALMLLVGAGLLIKSFARLQQVNPGFDPDSVLTFAISLPLAKYQEPHQNSAFFHSLITQLQSTPGVKSAGAVFGLPLSKGAAAATSFDLPGRAAPAEEPTSGLRIATPDYFVALKIPLQSGRYFEETDTEDAPGVAIINEAAARRYWPNEDPVGKSLRVHVSLIPAETYPRRIVGVVKDVKYNGLDADASSEIFIPHAQHDVEMMMVTVRTAIPPTALIPQVRKIVKGLDPNLPIWDVQTMDEVVGASVAERRFTTILLASFAALALILAAIGVYGVLSYNVAQRTREIGVRMALGAREKDVLRSILGEGLILAIAGIGFGLVGALGVTRVLSTLLFSVGTTDPFTFVTVILLLAGIAIMSSYLPARRATRVDPLVALRYE